MSESRKLTKAIHGDIKKKFEEQIDRLLAGSNGECQPWPGALKCEVFDQQHQFLIKTTLAGFEPKDIKVSAQHNVLTIDASKMCPLPQGLCVCRHAMRRFLLDPKVDVQKFKAKLDKDGILIVEAPKKNLPDGPIQQIPVEIEPYTIKEKEMESD